jgi:DNA repair exonuclease SbcCD ATPase subunit
MTKKALDKPEFVIGLRGYDRQQVDDYIDRLRGVAAEAEERARAAERRHDAAAADAIKRARAAEAHERERAAEAERRARAAQAELERKMHTTVGPRIAQIFDLAVEEANELRARAEAEAEAIRSSARGQIEEKCEERRRELDEIEAKCERGRRQLAQLEAKDEVLRADLRHLQAALQTVAGLIGTREDETVVLTAVRQADAADLAKRTG